MTLHLQFFIGVLVGILLVACASGLVFGGMQLERRLRLQRAEHVTAPMQRVP